MTNFHEARRVAARHFSMTNSLYYYTHGKIALDPVYPWVAKALAISTLPLLDVGCGAGQLAAFLRACGHKSPILGVDVDANKIAQAAAAISTCTFQVGDAMELPDHRGDVVMLDVLHYFDAPRRAAVLHSIAARLAPGGRGILRLTLKDSSWRFAVTRFEEWFVRVSGWIPFQSVGFPSREEIELASSEAGLLARISPMWGMTPFNSYLVELEKP